MQFNKKIKTGLLALAACAFMAPLLTQAKAIAPDQDSIIWSCGPIAISAEGNNLVEAKNKGVTQTRRLAFDILMKRLLSSAEKDSLTYPTDEKLLDMEFSLQFQSEKVGGSIYSAKLFFVWNSDKIIQWLTAQNIELIAVDPDPTMLIIANNPPILSEGNEYSRNDFIAAFDVFDPVKFVGNVNIFFSDSLSPNDIKALARKDAVTFARIADYNNTNEVKLLFFQKISGKNFLHEVYYAKGLISESLHPVDSYANVSENNWLLLLRQNLEHNWHEKRVASLKNRTDEEVLWTVNAQSLDPGYWQTLQDNIKSISWVQKLHILEISLEEITFEFVSVGSVSETLEALENRGVYLTPTGDGSWSLTIDTTQSGI